MFDFLSKKFSSIFSKFKGEGILTQADISQTLDQVRDSLLEADVPYSLATTFADDIKAEVTGQKITESLKPKEQLLKIVHDKLIVFMGGKKEQDFTFQAHSVVMVMGLQGSGKTTTLAKLAHFAQKQAAKKSKNHKILLASVDFYRPAAVDQLEVLAKQVGVDFYRAHEIDPIAAAKEIHDYYKNNSYELLLLDTAGRLHVDNSMLLELQNINVDLEPHYKLLVLDSMTGQESLNVAQAFEQAVGFDSAILSKMDSDARGGAAFSFRYALKKPVIFIGTGEKPEDLEQFYPERVAKRMLDMGDLLSLAEKADEKIKKSEQEKMQKSFMSGTMTLQDFADQMGMMSRLGSMSNLMKYMPGMGSIKISDEQLEQGEREMKKFKAIISSMTPKERLVPAILNGSRKKRIAAGSGTQVQEVNLLLSRFEQMKQYVKLLKKMGPLKGLFNR